MSANRIVRISLVTALIALTTSIAGTASQDRPGEVSGGSRQAIAGSWLETISPAAGPSFKALATYGEDGALVSSVQGSVITGPFPFPVGSSGHAHVQHNREATGVGFERRSSPVRDQASADGYPQQVRRCISSRV
jgi:hypothetical protein